MVSCESFLQFKDEIEHDYDYDLGFRNIGETVYNNITATTTSGTNATTTYAPKSQQFIGVNQVTKNVKIKLAQYMLRAEVDSALALKYAAVGLLFPIHVVVVAVILL